MRYECDENLVSAYPEAFTGFDGKGSTALVRAFTPGDEKHRPTAAQRTKSRLHGCVLQVVFGQFCLYYHAESKRWVDYLGRAS